MNLFDSSFLCLDIGSSAVRAVAHRVRSGRITKSAAHVVFGADTVFAIKSAVDELERQIGAHFDSAHITGNFGRAEFEMAGRRTEWSGEHKITPSDVGHQISRIKPGDGFYPMHVVPLRYDTPAARNVSTPVGYTDSQLISVFGAIFYETARLDEIFACLRRAHIRAQFLEDPSFLLDRAFRDHKQTAVFIDLGAEFTSLSIWTPRGPVFFDKLYMGQSAATDAIADRLGIGAIDAARIKDSVASVSANEMDRFAPADAAYDFSRADVNEVLLPILSDIIDAASQSLAGAVAKYNPTRIFVSGGGSGIEGIDKLLENTFKIPVSNLGADAAVNALGAYIWAEQAPRVRAYLARRDKWRNLVSKIAAVFARRPRRKIKFVPVMPSTLAFDMASPATYALFRSGNISMIHVDVMDGFFVDRIAGGIEQVKYIREHTNAHLYVHLMTESPAVWAAAAAGAGADTIVVSTNTAGVRTALQKIRELGKRSGIALNPESGVDILKPVLKEIDDVLVMSVKPGAGGQVFDDGVLHKISVLANTRKKYGLKFKIAVDGGINADTAQLCWRAGADYLASGSYLANSPDFPLAVQTLLDRR
ncbi:MAG: ribulose-phosphate 3-epimerase [Rickettsiales bacterium]|jgi:ribulose-phosphate 3-epimerase|nr:ribulose-phosphate 3-epimerase [Rickettsiales bacterium]